MAKQIRQILEPSKKTLIALLSRNLPPSTTKEQLEAIIDQEIFNYEYKFVFKPEYLDSLESSIEMGFRKMILKNLSFDDDLGLTYMQTREMTIQGKKEKVLFVTPSVNGTIAICRMAGSLEDVKTSLEKDKNGLIENVIVTLIIPKYSSDCVIESRSEMKFTIGKDDFKVLQKKSHLQNTGRSNGSLVTLSNSNQLYWNYRPDGSPCTPDNPGGIDPSFAITKAIKIAITRAKLDQNINGKKFNVEHKRYVDETIDEIEIYEDIVVPDFPPPVIQGESEPIFKAQVSPEQPKNQAPIFTPSASKDQIIKEAESCKTSDEVMVVFKKHKAEIDKDASLKASIVKIGTDRKKPAPIENKVTADNI